MSPKKILIVAGEPSGDLYASILAKDLKRIIPDLEFLGLGGSLSKDAGVETVFDISKLALIGVIEVLKNIFAVRKAYDAVLKRVDSTKIDLAILVDYPGFNLRLAKALNKRFIPVVYYISPQVWAWGTGRINRIKKYVRKIIVFFKFEEDLYKKHDINVEFVGHPLLDIVKTTLPKETVLKKYNLSKDKITIALLPGSRELEAKLLLPIMISSCRIIDSKLNTKMQFVIAKHKDLPANLYEEVIRNSRLDMRLADSDTYNILSIADFAIVASGTATLESAIIGVPFIIVYKVNFVTFLLFKIVSKTPFLGLVNIIARKMVVPELLQFDVTPEKVAEKTIEILTDEKKKTSMLEDLKSVKSSLGTPGASERAASAILPFLK